MEIVRSKSDMKWESELGSCSAVKAGNLIMISGLMPVEANGKVVSPGDPYHQTRYCMQVLFNVLAQMGGESVEVVRTRVYIDSYNNWSAVAKAHREAFSGDPPTSSVIQIDNFLFQGTHVQFEVEAVC